MRIRALVLWCLGVACFPLAACTPTNPMSDGGTDGGAIMCRAGGISTFPTFDKRCSGPADCFIGFHQTDCCGSNSAIGINVAERTRFQSAEKACEAMYPACGCAPRPLLAEDGNTTPDQARIVVDCRANACTTRVM